MNVITNNLFKCKQALSALQEVTDPEVGLNIVDLGLIYQVDFDEATKKIYAQMTLTTQFCPMGSSILDSVRQALKLAFPGEDVELQLTFVPQWNAERISETGRIFLNK